MKDNSNHLNHSRWECKYHIIFIPKYRRKVLYDLLCKDLQGYFHRLAKQKECVIEEGYLKPDKINMLINIPRKHSVSTVVGFLKGESSILISQNINNKHRNL